MGWILTTSATVCVTGAAGFIGSWLVTRLLESGYNVHATVRNLGTNKFSAYMVLWGDN